MTQETLEQKKERELKFIGAMIDAGMYEHQRKEIIEKYRDTVPGRLRPADLTREDLLKMASVMIREVNALTKAVGLTTEGSR